MISRVFANIGQKHRTTLLSQSLSAAPAYPPAQYLFEALVTVNNERWAEFDKRVGAGQAAFQLLALFQKVGLQIRHSTYRVVDAHLSQFVNYWELGTSMDNLPRAEIELSDHVLWAEFDDCVMRGEDKDIITPILSDVYNPPAKHSLSLHDDPHYMRVVYDVRPADLEEFQARLEANLEPFAALKGWLLGQTYLYVTGREGRIVQLWLLKGEPLQKARDPKLLWRDLHEMPWLFSAEGTRVLEHRSLGESAEGYTNPEVSFHQLTPVDPYIALPA